MHKYLFSLLWFLSAILIKNIKCTKYFKDKYVFNCKLNNNFQNNLHFYTLQTWLYHLTTISWWRTARLPWVTSPTFFDSVTSSVSAQTARSPTCEWEGRHSITAWRTACLYGVSYSRASPRFFLGVIFVSNILKVAHKVLIDATYSRGSSLVLSSSVIFSGLW